MQKIILTGLAIAAFTIAIAQQAIVHGQTVTPTPTPTPMQVMSMSPTPTTSIPKGAPATGHGQY